MKVTPELDRILHRSRAPNQLSTFLEKEQLFGVDDVALVCTKEELFDETLIAPAKAAGVPCDSLAEKVCIKKVWALCRETFTTWRHGQPASQTEQDDQVLPDEVNEVWMDSCKLATGSSSIRFVCRTASLSKLPLLEKIRMCQRRSLACLSSGPV